jgi:2-iminobutanoate/2-iminopropanoate deaminase
VSGFRDGRRRLAPTGREGVSREYSQGWAVDGWIYVSGQVSVDDGGRLLGAGDVAEQARNVFENITSVLRDADADWGDVVKLTTFYVVEGGEAEAETAWSQILEVRREYLPDPPPAATAARVAGLVVPGALVEAEVIARRVR